MNNLKDTTLILGHYLNRSMYPDDTVRVDEKGYGIFKGKQKLPEGLYIIFLPSTNYFEIIMGNDQHFSIQTDTFNFVNTLDIKGSEENQIFLDFQRYMVMLRAKADSLSSLRQNDQNNQEKLTRELQGVNSDRIAMIEDIAKEHPELFVGKFLKSTLEVDVPDPPRDAQGNIIDSDWQYYYYRNHYFDNFDLSDVRLLRTPLYEDKMINYISMVIPQIPDTVIYETDRIIELAKSDSTLFRYVLVTLFNHFGKSNIMGMDAVQMHIAEKYYIPGSWWSDSSFIADLKTRVEKTKPLLIGKIAPDMELMSVPSSHFIEASKDTSIKRYPHVGTKITLHQIAAKYTVLLFWEADCGHCKTAVPELYDLYLNALAKYDVKILAISTLFGEEGKMQWSDFVNEHQIYNWINAWNPYSYEYKLTYDILSTPQIYLLDESKKIIAKKISPSQVEEIIVSLSNI
ncbi:MAG: redoxin domain-containing protein [Bacteroidales bacterium]|nr:redoxin domain-containing protein [Bacteroidales bacterium]